jgi:hypothetical protein
MDSYIAVHTDVCHGTVRKARHCAFAAIVRSVIAKFCLNPITPRATHQRWAYFPRPVTYYYLEFADFDEGVVFYQMR